MNTKDRIFLLEDALIQAQHTVKFLHNCLVDPDNGEMKGGYSYDHPEQTIRHLEEWAELVPLPPLCHHSHSKPGCESCRLNTERRRRLGEIKEKEKS